MAHNGNDLTTPLLREEQIAETTFLDMPGADLTDEQFNVAFQTQTDETALLRAQAYYNEGCYAAKKLVSQVRKVMNQMSSTPKALAHGVVLNLGLGMGIAFVLLAEAIFPQDVEADNGANAFKIIGFVTTMFAAIFFHSSVPRIAKAIATARQSQVPALLTPFAWDRVYGGALNGIKVGLFVNKIQKTIKMPMPLFIILEILSSGIPFAMHLAKIFPGFSSKFMRTCLARFKRESSNPTLLPVSANHPASLVGSIFPALAAGSTASLFMSTLINFFYDAYVPGTFDPDNLQTVQISMLSGVSCLCALICMSSEAGGDGVRQFSTILTNIIAILYLGMNTIGMVHPQQFANSSDYPGATARDEVTTILIAVTITALVKKITPGPWEKVTDLKNTVAEDLARKWGIDPDMPTCQSWFKWLQLLSVPYVPVYKQPAIIGSIEP